jgi:hypothetical protein
MFMREREKAARASVVSKHVWYSYGGGDVVHRARLEREERRGQPSVRLWLVRRDGQDRQREASKKKICLSGPGAVIAT